MKTELKRREIELYDRLAHQYDNLTDQASLRGLGVASKLISDFTSGLEEIIVLDLGCGTGRYFGSIRNYTEIVGVDLSEKMLHVAKNKIQDRKIDLIRADVFNLPIVRKARFDVIISIGVLGMHVPVTNKILVDLRCLLKRKGQILFTANLMSRHWREVIKRKCYELLRRKPNSRFLSLLRCRFPVQPYAETLWLLKMKLERSGYIIERIEKVQFAAEQYVIFARVGKVAH